MTVEPVTGIPSAQDPAVFLDETFVFRRFCCPGCFVKIATEVARIDEPIFSEMRLGSAVQDGSGAHSTSPLVTPIAARPTHR